MTSFGRKKPHPPTLICMISFLSNFYGQFCFFLSQLSQYDTFSSRRRWKNSLFWLENDTKGKWFSEYEEYKQFLTSVCDLQVAFFSTSPSLQTSLQGIRCQAILQNLIGVKSTRIVHMKAELNDFKVHQIRFRVFRLTLLCFSCKSRINVTENQSPGI